MKRLNKGSALLVTLLVMVILTLTGISFLFMADTENKISNNYYMAMRALVAAQSGVYLVNSWFNHPSDGKTLLPASDQIGILPRENTSSTKPAAGKTTLYKWGCTGDNDGCANYKLFDKPFMGINETTTVFHRFFGTETNPDILISYYSNVQKQKEFLDSVNTLILGTATGPVRISEIKLYSPPLSPYPDDVTNVANTPYGICTVQITAETVRRNSDGTVAEVFSTRRVKGIITDINYAITGVALDVDGSISINGAVSAYWGIVKTMSDISDNNPNHLAAGSPWYINTKGIPQLCGSLFGTPTEGQLLQGRQLQDPWLVIRSKGSVSYGNGPNAIEISVPSNRAKQDAKYWLLPEDLKTSNCSCDYVHNSTLTAPNQNYLIAYRTTNDGTWYSDCKECNGRDDAPLCGITSNDCSLGGTIQRPISTYNEGNYYNVIGFDPTIAFASGFRGYTYWKNVITNAVKQGGGDAYYLVPGGAEDEDGNKIGLCSTGQWGPPNDATNCKDFETWTSGQKGFWFFDTKDGKIPKTDSSNIAEGVDVKGGYWSEGVQYICAKEYNSAGGSGHDFPNCFFPGEPLWENPDLFYKAKRNGVYDEKDDNNNFIDRFLNLKYPAPDDYDDKSVTYEVDANAGNADCSQSPPTLCWDKYGPSFTFTGYFKGVLYLTGKFIAHGSRRFFGSVMIWDADAQSGGTVDVWYNPKLQEGVVEGLPQATVEQIITDM